MKKKLSSLIFPVLLLMTAIVASAAGQEELLQAPLNPDFVDWQSRKTASSSLGKVSAGDLYNFGYIPSPFDWSHLRLELPATPRRLAAPVSYDLRSLGYVSPVRDQGSCGDCWAFATYGSLEGWLKKSLAEDADFSENHMKNYHGFDWGPCDGGNEDMSTAYLSRWSGPVSESADPYHDWDDRPSPGGPPQKYVKSALRFSTPDAIKNAVMTYGALYTTMYYTAGSYNSAQKTYYYTGTAAVNHGVTLVGWDDNKVVTGAPGNGAWIIKNSWGPSWGEGGYFYISYYDSRAVADALTFKDAVNTSEYAVVYQYDPLGMTGSIGCGTSTFMWGANIFTPLENGDLAAVGFYALQNNTSYEISVYDNFIGTSFSSLLGFVSGIAANAGYYTVTLPSPIALTAGNSFGIVVKFTTPGYTFPLPVESPFAGYSSTASANAGESYYSCNGSTFYDMTTAIAKTNISIKGLAVHLIPNISASPLSHDFGTVAVGALSPAQTFTVSNGGTGPLIIGILNPTGANPSHFVKENDTCSGQTLLPSGSCTVDARFSPQSAGAKTASLSIPSNDPDTQTLNISLSGTGEAQQPPVAGFSGSPVSGPAPLTVSFTDLSTNTPTSWSWTFGDSGTSTQQNPLYVYQSAGTYTVSLTATNMAGSSTETKTGYITVPCPVQPVRITGAPPAYYSALQSAYNVAPDSAIIQAQAATLTETVNLNRSIAVTLKAGYNACYTANPGNTTIIGSLTITSGTVTVENIVIQ